MEWNVFNEKVNNDYDNYDNNNDMNKSLLNLVAESYPPSFH